jgi:hypothetical protein
LEIPDKGFNLPVNGAFTLLKNTGDLNNKNESTRNIFRVDDNNNNKTSNDEEAFISSVDQLFKPMLNVPGVSQLIREQVSEYALEKYPDIRDKSILVEGELQVLQGKVLSRNLGVSEDTRGNLNEIPRLLTKSLVRDDLFEVTTPVMGVVKNRSECKVAKLNDNPIKIVRHNSWHYSSLNNYNNPNLPKAILKKNIVRIWRDNEMKARDPSGQYKNFSSWKEKVQARIEDKIIKEVNGRNLPLEENWRKLSEKKKKLYNLLEESDYIPRKKVNEILYGDLGGRVIEQQYFSRKGGQWYLATSSENPPS